MARELPVNVDAEKALMGSMLMSRDAIDVGSRILTDVEAFSIEAHRALFKAVCSIHGRGIPVEFLSVEQELKRTDASDLVEMGYLIELAESFSDTANADYYAQQVLEMWQRRRIIRVCGRMADSAYGIERTPSEIVAEFGPQLDDTSSTQHEPRRLTDIVVELPAWWNRTRQEAIRTGIVALDSELGGLERPSYVLVGARPSVGKSSFLLHLANMAGDSGVPTLFFVLEAGTMRTAQRFVANHYGRSTGALRHMSSPEDQRHAVDCTRQREGSSRIYLMDRAVTLHEILATARHYIRRRGVRMVIVDYLQIIRPSQRHENRNLEITAASDALRRLSLDMDVQVTAAAQLRRPAPGSDHRPPRLSDLRESGSLEQDADVVIMLHREIGDQHSERLQHNKQIDVIVAKNKDGPTPAFSLDFNCQTFTFSSEATPYDHPEPGRAREQEGEGTTVEADHIPF